MWTTTTTCYREQRRTVQLRDLGKGCLLYQHIDLASFYLWHRLPDPPRQTLSGFWCSTSGGSTWRNPWRRASTPSQRWRSRRRGAHTSLISPRTPWRRYSPPPGYSQWRTATHCKQIMRSVKIQVGKWRTQNPIDTNFALAIQHTLSVQGREYFLYLSLQTLFSSHTQDRVCYLFSPTLRWGSITCIPPCTCCTAPPLCLRQGILPVSLLALAAQHPLSVWGREYYLYPSLHLPHSTPSLFEAGNMTCIPPCTHCSLLHPGKGILPVSLLALAAQYSFSVWGREYYLYPSLHLPRSTPSLFEAGNITCIPPCTCRTAPPLCLRQGIWPVSLLAPTVLSYTQVREYYLYPSLHLLHSTPSLFEAGNITCIPPCTHCSLLHPG